MKDFDKSDFQKGALAPLCKTCGARARIRTPDNLHWQCKICDHPVDDDGKCKSKHRCVPCRGRPKCANCGRMSVGDGKTGFHCESCEHSLDDDGHCRDDPCHVCNPYSCNTCDSTLEGELDGDDEIYCNECEHYVDEDGDCVSSDRGHCSTCDTYPDCPSCGSDTSENGYEDEDGDYIKRYSCDEGCYHEIDSDGDCRTESCNSCYPIECSSCDSSIYDESDSDGHVWCSECECYVDEDGDRLYGTYTCNTCNEDIEGRLDSDGEIQCETCDHYIDSDGDCATDDCSTCASDYYTCNNCGESIYGQLDEDGEIKCETCDHYIDSDGDCATSDCSTCASDYYTCNKCGESIYGQLDEDGEIKCETCDHYIDSDGDCATSDCSTCDGDDEDDDDDDDDECDECGKQPCTNGVSCWYHEKGDCWYCHCGGEVERIENHKFPNCPNCEDNDDVIYDYDLSYYCNYCNSNF